MTIEPEKKAQPYDIKMLEGIANPHLRTLDEIFTISPFEIMLPLLIGSVFNCFLALAVAIPYQVHKTKRG